MILTITTIEYLVPVISGTILFVLLTIFVIYFILLYRRTNLKLHWERERLKQELLRVENEVQEQTLQNVSRELHDNFGQVASLIKINLMMATKELPEGGLDKVNDSLELLKQLIGDIKALSASLDGEKIKEIGWVPAIREEIERINKIGGTQISIEVPSEAALKPDQEVILYRVLQEIFNNTLKHANAENAWLSIKDDHRKVVISYRDDGKGFDPDTIRRGSGLNNMEARCQMIGGAFALKSERGTGSSIEISIPYEQ